MTGRHDGRKSGKSGLAGLGPRVAGRWRRLTGAAAATAVAFGLLACACSLVAVAGPRASDGLRTRAVRQLVSTTPALDKTVVGISDADTLATAMGGTVGRSQLEQVRGELGQRLSQIVPLASPASDWAGLTTPFTFFPDRSPRVIPGDSTQVELTYRDDLSAHVHVVAGALPARRPAGFRAKVPVAVTTATASRFNLHVGSHLAPPAGTGVVLVVTGIVAPTAPGSPFWQFDPVMTAPVLHTPANGSPYWQGGVFVAASALLVLATRFSPQQIQVTWMFGLGLSQLTAAQAGHLVAALPGQLTQAGVLQFASFQSEVNVGMTTGVLQVLTQFVQEESGVSPVVDLLSVSLAVVGAAVLLLAAWLMAEQRREEFGVLRTRGASRRQLAAASLAGCGVAAVPGAAAGIVIAVLLTLGSAASLAWWLAGLTVTVALAGPALIAVRMHRGAAAAARPDRQPSRIGAARRAIAEVALAAASVGGLLVLRHQGLGGGNSDLYASAAPILIAVPVAILAIRVYPLALRPLLAVVSRRRGVTGFLGLARAARVSATAVLPVFAMVLALSLVSFAGMVRGAVGRGDVASSWQEAGADAVISVPQSLPPARQRAITAVPGVQRAAAVALTSATKGFVAGGLTTVIADPAQYTALLASEPVRPAPASFATWTPRAGSGPVPVLASPAMAAVLGHAAVPLQLQYGPRIVVRLAGIVPAMSQVPAIGGVSAAYLVLPRAALRTQAPPPNAMLLTGSGIDAGALTTLLRHWQEPAAGLVLRSQVLAALEQAPLLHDAYTEFALGGAAAGIGCLLVLLLTLLLSAQSRELTLARATTMGLSSGQGRTLAVIELLPQLVAVLIGGLAAGLALAPLVGPALSLSVFTESATGVRLQLEPLWLTATAIGLVVLAIATLTGQMALAGRRTPRSLRIGS